MYLEDQVRKVFRDCYIDALEFSHLSEVDGNYERKRELFLRIESLGNLILSSIHLPSLQTLESEKFSDIWTSIKRNTND